MSNFLKLPKNPKPPSKKNKGFLLREAFVNV